jgi:hypothetical protein
MMKTKIDLEIYNQLVRYLAQEITLEQFRDWFDASTWNIEQSGANQDALDLSAEIELRLAEFSSGHWSENELRSRLLPFVGTYIQREQLWGAANSWYRTSSSNVTVSPLSQAVGPGLPAGTRASVAFV